MKAVSAAHVCRRIQEVAWRQSCSEHSLVLGIIVTSQRCIEKQANTALVGARTLSLNILRQILQWKCRVCNAICRTLNLRRHAELVMISRLGVLWRCRTPATVITTVGGTQRSFLPAKRVFARPFSTDPSSDASTFLESKVQRLHDLLSSTFEHESLPEIEVVRSRPTHFRHSVAFDVWAERPPPHIVREIRKRKSQQAVSEQNQKEEESEQGSTLPTDEDEKPNLYFAMYKRFSELDPEELQVIDDGGHTVQVMRERVGRRARKKNYTPQDPKCRLLMRVFDTATEPICDLMPSILDQLEENFQLRHKCFQVKFRSTEATGKVMVVLYYHRSIDNDAWREAATELRNTFPDQIEVVVGRARRELVPLFCDHQDEVYSLPASEVGVEIAPAAERWVPKENVCAVGAPGNTSGSAASPYLTLEERQVVISQPENCFIQPNATVCRQMMTWARDSIVRHRARKLWASRGGFDMIAETPSEADAVLAEFFAGTDAEVCFTGTNSTDTSDAQPVYTPELALDLDGGHLLELHCGVGTFTCALAPLFEQVLATELNPRAVHALRRNLLLNKLQNVTCAVSPAQDVAFSLERAIHRVRVQNNKAFAASQLISYQHLFDNGDLVEEEKPKEYNFSTVLVDPPRSGLDEATRDVLSAFPTILYISCNPDSLRRDVEVLAETHTVQAAGFFDQFPGPQHSECGLLLERRDLITY